MALADWRLDHIWALVKQHRDINAVRAELAREISATIRDQCEGMDTYDAVCHARVSRYINMFIWPRYHSRFRGDFQPAFPRAVEAAAVRGFMVAWKRAGKVATEVLRRRDPELLAALQDMAKERDNA